MPLGSEKAGLMAASAGASTNYFGDGSDGAVTSSGDITYTPANQASDYDGDMVVKNFTTFTLSVGDTLTVNNGCSGLLLYSTGNMTINGTIDMDGRGCTRNTGWTADNPIDSSDAIWLPMFTASPGSQTLTVAAADFTNCGAAAIAAVANQPGIAGDGTLFTISGGGGGSGRTEHGNSALRGNDGTGGVRSSGTYEMWIRTGGGASGGAQHSSAGNASSGSGGGGSPISGGSGGGGCGAEGTTAAANAATGTAAGGSGAGAGNNSAGGGGGGQPGGSGGATGSGTIVNGTNGNGGIIWIICGGTLTLGASSEIFSRGSGGGGAQGSKSGGGGGSGGGAAHLIYVTSYSDGGCTFNFDGAEGGNSNADGGTGGDGGYIATAVSAA